MENTDTVNAFQVFWTVPMGERKHSIPEFVIYTMVISALMWKKNHHLPVKLFTDSWFRKRLEQCGADAAWDSLDVETFRSIRGIDTAKFWSVGKFYAYRKESAPCICIDTDMILWNNIFDLLKDSSLVCSYREKTEENAYYYSKETDAEKGGLFSAEEWDWSLPALNTSICYFRDNEFKDYYTEKVLEYMKLNSSSDSDADLSELLFAEQRILPMCGKKKGILDDMKLLFDMTWHPEQGIFTDRDQKKVPWKYYELHNHSRASHIWVEKCHIQNDPDRRKRFEEEALEIIGSLDEEICHALKNSRAAEGQQ